ncbi:MAG: hypothetical protein JWP97_2271 [Labilithrix sp.]|nr:hypothetical protein [Labilithrix sp.]
MVVRRLRFRAPLALVALLAVFAIGACSGAAGTELFDEPESGGIRTVPTPDSGASPGAPADASAADAARPPPVDAATPDAAPPVATCTTEAEPDDDLEDATPFTTDFCGQVSGQSDQDFGTFTVPAGAKSMLITHTETGGKVAYRYYKNGQLLPIAAELPATPGTVYAVLVRRAAGSKDADQPTYALHVAFD